MTTRLDKKAEQILQGALPEFLKNGYADTSMDRVAQAAGVSKQTLYSHFYDKDGLFTALVKRMAAEKFRLVWSKPLTGKPEEVLRELAYRLLKEAGDPEHLRFMRLVIAQSEKRPDLAQIFLKNVAQPSIKILTQYLQQQSELNIVDAEATARIFVGSVIHFILTQEMFYGQEIMPMSEERLVENLVQLIVK
ncbi:transcriptional regulator, TetR family [Gloeothece citriformis PCC 7424]|uniref:Transcriptional regulator, TetR family n=1 Tax=Gloeothece citriformis (strain PCC 7424) TaxID=65393 RepID=B7KBH5_GLOC7|nr:TetR/AcrR family transcriptional regulator [Gloeothece citriformis]ACK71531.1 transcriptional regulator, TetR family [Gloeothece citriformis PCC 7424]